MKDGNKIDLYSDGNKDQSRNEAFSILEEIHVKERKLLYDQAGNGLISYEELGRQIDLMMKDNDYLAMHQYTIWYNNKTEYWYTYLPDSAGRRQIKSRKKSELIRRIIAYYKENESKRYFRDIVYKWLDQKIRYGEITESTYTKYENTYKRFFKKDSFFCNTLLEDMNDTIVEDFIRKTISDFHLTRKAYSDFQIVLKGGLLYAKKVEKCTTYSIASFLLELNLSDKIFAYPEKKRDEDEVFSEEEELKLKDYLWKHSDIIENLGLLLALDSGVRVGELATLHWSDVISDDEIHIEATETSYRDRETHNRVVTEGVKPKTVAGNRYIVLPESSNEILEAIKIINPHGKYIFSRKDDPKKFITGRMFNYYLHKACTEVGINPRSTHKLRKTYATSLSEKKVDDRIIMKQMGHTSIATTKESYIWSRKDKEQTKAIISDARTIKDSDFDRAIKGNQTK